MTIVRIKPLFAAVYMIQAIEMQIKPVIAIARIPVAIAEPIKSVSSLSLPIYSFQSADGYSSKFSGLSRIL